MARWLEYAQCVENVDKRPNIQVFDAPPAVRTARLEPARSGVSRIMVPIGTRKPCEARQRTSRQKTRARVRIVFEERRCDGQRIGNFVWRQPLQPVLDPRANRGREGIARDIGVGDIGEASQGHIVKDALGEFREGVAVPDNKAVRVFGTRHRIADRIGLVQREEYRFGQRRQKAHTLQA